MVYGNYGGLVSEIGGILGPTRSGERSNELAGMAFRGPASPLIQSPLRTPRPTREAVASQLVCGVDAAVSVGERALGQASAELGFLYAKLNDVSQDREVWAQRFYAMRELQASARLCEQALRLSDCVN